MISNTEIMKELASFKDQGLVTDSGITEAGLAAIAPYKVHKALILATGFGSRMMPATEDRPKPMVSVNDVCIISTLLEALLAAGVDDITIVRGYQKEKFDELLADYSNLHFIDNDAKEKANKTVEALSDHSKTYFHGRQYHIDELKEIGIKVKALEEMDKDKEIDGCADLQDCLLTVHHSYMQSFANSNTIKIIENQNGNAMIVNTMKE